MFCPNTLQHLNGSCTREDVGSVELRVSFGTVRITDLDFADDAVIFTEAIEVLA